VKRTLGRETERQYTTTRLEYEQKQKEQTTPSPSELKRKETKEFAQDVSAIVSTAEVELPSVPQPTIAKDPFSQAAVLTGAPVPEERKYTRYKRASDIILEKAAEIHEQQTKPGLPHIVSFGGKVKTAPMYEATAGAVSAVEDVSPRFKPPTRQPIYPRSYFLGKAASSMAVGYVLSKTMVEPYVEEVSRAWRGSRAEMWLIRHSRWYRQRAARTIAPGIVDIPEFGKAGPRELLKQQMAWELAETPKTSALLITKYTGPTGKRASAWVMEHWFKRVTGGLSYTLVKSELEQVKPIAPETRKGLPHIPKVEPLKKGRMLPLVRATILSTRMLEKPASPQKITVLPEASAKQITETTQASRQAQQQTQKIIGLTTIRQRQYQKVIETPTRLQLTIQRPPHVPPRFPGKKKKKKYRAMPPGFGWVRLEWPVAGPEKVLETVIGGKRK